MSQKSVSERGFLKCVNLVLNSWWIKSIADTKPHVHKHLLLYLRIYYSLQTCANSYTHTFSLCFPSVYHYSPSSLIHSISEIESFTIKWTRDKISLDNKYFFCRSVLVNCRN